MNYLHDRAIDVFQQNRRLYGFIEEFSKNAGISLLCFYYGRFYGLPKDVILRKIKRRMRFGFKNNLGRFDPEIGLIHLLHGVVKHVGFLIVILLRSRVIYNSLKRRLIIDDIGCDDELEIFKKMVRLCGDRNIAVVAFNNLEGAYEFDWVVQERLKGYDCSIVLPVVFKDLLFAVPLLVVASLLAKTNLFYFATRVSNDFAYYSSMFKRVQGEYLLQMRHIKMSPLRSYLFKRAGGTAACCVQKSILQADETSFYYDVDIFFSLGKLTVTRAYDYGARIGRVVPVGSLFMERNFNDEVKRQLGSDDYLYDVVMIGINVMNARERMDAYDEFNADYYKTIEWVVRLKAEMPKLRVAIKHHSSAGVDEIENDLLRGSEIVIIPQHEDSYLESLRSRICVTYGSTMGYEICSLERPVIFLDPGCRNSLLEECRKDDFYGEQRAVSYEEFRGTVSGVIDEGRTIQFGHAQVEDFCMEPAFVSERIAEVLCK